MRLLLAALRALPALLLLLATPARAESILDRCTAETCQARLTSAQLLHEIEELILDKRYDDAKPLLAALAANPALHFETRFLGGYIAEQTGDLAHAESLFRAILVDDPKQTRVRLELGKVLLARGHRASADHQLRLAEQDGDLPPEIARTIRSVRTIIRSQRAWTLNFDIGIAPDSNINNATAADTVTVLFGTQPIPLTLDKAARARSGTGVTASVDAGLRLPVAKGVSAVVDVDAFGTQYPGTDYDDLSLEVTAGPEFKLSRAAQLRIEGVAAERDFGNRIASRQLGVKLGFETMVGKANRLGLQVDARHTYARFDPNYSGWQMGAYATYERVVARSLIASASVFARADRLTARAYSNTEVGGVAGIGGELPMGFNIGLSAGGSRAVYRAPLPIFSVEPRKDWRLNARLTVGNRKIRVLGFSPSASISYGRSDSTIHYYSTQRTRFRVALARYF